MSILFVDILCGLIYEKDITSLFKWYYCRKLTFKFDNKIAVCRTVVLEWLIILVFHKKFLKLVLVPI